MDLVLKLREARRMRGLTQKDVARMSGVGEKTISSFETGERIGSLKLKQLERLLSAYGLSPADFFGSTIEKNMAPWELDVASHVAPGAGATRMPGSANSSYPQKISTSATIAQGSDVHAPACSIVRAVQAPSPPVFSVTSGSRGRAQPLHATSATASGDIGQP